MSRFHECLLQKFYHFKDLQFHAQLDNVCSEFFKGKIVHLYLAVYKIIPVNVDTMYVDVLGESLWFWYPRVNYQNYSERKGVAINFLHHFTSCASLVHIKIIITCVTLETRQK